MMGSEANAFVVRWHSVRCGMKSLYIDFRGFFVFEFISG
jgi:hypothetical protein